ncbi:MAG: TonB family protein [Candidatus Acidiferrales bacterium]
MNGLGSLAGCMVDGDREALKRARWLRRKALVASIGLEAVVVAAMLIWPLITLAVLPRQFIVTPTLPYHGGGNTQPARPRSQHPAERNHSPKDPTFYQPREIPRHAPEAPGAEEPSIDFRPSDRENTLGPGWGGPIIHDGNDDPSGSKIPAPPPEKKPALEPVKRSEGVMAASLIRRVQPLYPAVAKAMRLSGVVQLRAIIGTDGSVRRLEALSGNPILVQPAVAAVREWRYLPTLLSGEAVEVETLITVHFILE